MHYSALLLTNTPCKSFHEKLPHAATSPLSGCSVLYMKFLNNSYFQSPANIGEHVLSGFAIVSYFLLHFAMYIILPQNAMKHSIWNKRKILQSSYSGWIILVLLLFSPWVSRWLTTQRIRISCGFIMSASWHAVTEVSQVASCPWYT